jgi:hypothetical protein
MRRVEMKKGVFIPPWPGPPYVHGKPPKSRRTEGTILVYKVDRKRLDSKTPEAD